MAPPGRRKCSSFMLLALFTLLLLATTASAASAVLGIDLGTEYIKAAIAKPGSPIEIVLTKDSKRKEAATLAFKPTRAQLNDGDAFPERLYGGDALALSARYPGDVYPNLKTLLGLPQDSDTVQQYSFRYPGLVIEAIPRTEDKTGAATVGFKSQNAGQKKDAFMVEELLAMQLKNIRVNAEAAVVKGTYVTDVVITYPSFFTADEKRAIQMAADLAGLRVLGYISDGLAVGLNYATNRAFESINDGAKPEYHLVYDMGAGSTTATVLKFQGRTVKGYGKRNQTIQEVQVLASAFERDLGGDALNDLVVDDMVTSIVDQPKAKKLGIQANQLRKHGKSMARIWKDAERIRQILSANSAASASFEGLYDDDFTAKYSLTRDRFEQLVRGYASRVDQPLIAALDQAGITLEELDSIILHGGVIRTPIIQKKLEAIVGGVQKIKTNVNADEAAVLGAAFKAAALSPSFRVKDIRTTDIAGTSFTMKWTTDGKERQQKLFTPTSLVGVEKQVPIKALDDIKFEFSQNLYTEKLIVEIETTNLTKSVTHLRDKYGCASANITTQFNIRLNPADSLPEVVSGSVSCMAETVKEGGVIDNVKGLFGFGSKKNTEQAPLAEEEDTSQDNTASTPLPVEDPTSSASTISSASPTDIEDSTDTATSAEPTTSLAKATKATPSMVVIPLALKARPLGLNVPPSGFLPRIKQRLVQFDSSDKNAASRSEALNSLESFTYRARDYLADESFVALTSDKARKELEKRLSAASEWLYGDGVDAKLQDFKDKLKELRGLVDPVLKRKDENSKRDAAVTSLNSGLESMTEIIKMVESSIERASQDAASIISSAASSVAEQATSVIAEPVAEGDGLDDDPYGASSATEPLETESIPPMPKPYEYTKEDLSALTSSYESIKLWLEEKLAAQGKLSLYDDPAVLVADLEAKAKQIQSLVSETIMKTIKMQDIPRKPKSSRKSKAKSKKTKSSSDSSSTVASSSATSTSSRIKDEL